MAVFGLLALLIPAGVSPWDRFTLYVNTELSKQPLESADACIAHFTKLYPSLLENDFESEGAALDDQSPTLEPEQHCNAAGRSFSVTVWEPVDGSAKANIRWLRLCFYAPYAKVDIRCLCLCFYTPWTWQGLLLEK